MRRLLSVALLAQALSSCGPGYGNPRFGDPRFASLEQGAGAYANGIDRAGVLSVSEAQTETAAHGFSWSGAYIGGPCNGGSGWTPNALTAINQAVGWKFMPIYVGQTSNVCSHSNFTAGQGTTDGQDTVAIMATYSWAANGGIPVCLDFEAQNPASAAYVGAWVNAVHAGGYKAYLYSNGSNINALGGLGIDGVWSAVWPYNAFVAGLSPYDGRAGVTAYQNHDRAWQYAGAGNFDYSVSDIVLAPPPGQINGPAPTLDQLSANDAITGVNWKSGETEAFFTSATGDAMHVWTTGTTETWNAAATLAPNAECGSSSIFWPDPWLYTELFSPLADGGTGHLWWTSGTWNTYQGYGGSGLSHFQNLTWQDGHTEVFALGTDQSIWHQYWDLSMSAWSGWSSLGGSAVSGPGPIVFDDGHAELLVTAPGGNVSHVTSAATATGWSTWSAVGGSLASRPTPVRAKDGTVHAYAVGTDGHLQESIRGASGWSAFAAVETQTALVGEVFAIPNPSGSVEVFARDSTGAVVHTASGSPWPAFQALGASQVAASDPYALVRLDGTVEAFAIDGTGQLNLIHRDTTGAWGSWQALATGARACAPALPGPDGGNPGNDGGNNPGPDGGNPSGRDGGGGTTPDAGNGGGTATGCHCGAVPGVELPGLLLAGLAALARRRTARRR